MKNPVPKKGVGTRVFGGKTYHYAGTVNPVATKSVALQLANQGIRSRITQNNQLWIDNPRIQIKANPKARGTTTVPITSDKLQKALSMRERYREDAKAGHTDAAEYWRGQAGAYFTGNPLKKFCCSVCGTCVPKRLLLHKKFSERMSWLRHHYMEKHPELWPWIRKSNPVLETADTKSTKTIYDIITKAMGKPITKPTKIQLKRWNKMPDPTMVSKKCHDEAWQRGMII